MAGHEHTGTMIAESPMALRDKHAPKRQTSLMDGHCAVLVGKTHRPDGIGANPR